MSPATTGPALPATLNFAPGSDGPVSHQTQERRQRRAEYRAAVLAYRAAVAGGEDLGRLHARAQRVERARMKALPDCRRAVDRELGA